MIKATRSANGHRPRQPTANVPRHRRGCMAAVAAIAVVVGAGFLLVAGLAVTEATGLTNFGGAISHLFAPTAARVAEVDEPGAGKDSTPMAGAGKDVRGKVQPPPPTPARAVLDLKYIPAGATAVVIVAPRRIVQSPVAAPALPGGMVDGLVKELGVKADQIEQVIAILQTPPAAAPAAVQPAPKDEPKDDWTELSSKDGRFSGRFPVAPKESDRKTTLGTRKVFTAETDGTTLEIAYVDFAKDSPFVGDRSRIDFATRALEFKPGFKDVKDIKLDNHLGAEVVIDDAQLRTYSVHRVYVVRDRLYHLEATTRKAQKPPAEFARFFASFKVMGAPAPMPMPVLDRTPVPGVILRFAEPVDGKKLLTGLLKGLREESHAGKTYYRSSTGEAIEGLPLAGAVVDARTVLVAAEPILRQMLTADGTAKSPLLDRLRKADTADDVTGILIVEPHRELLRALIGPFAVILPPELKDAARLPDRLVAVTAVVNLRAKTLLNVSLETDNEEQAAALDDLAFKGLNWARKVYPAFRPTLLQQLPAEAAGPTLAVLDQVFGGIQVSKEGKRLVIGLEKPPAFATPSESALIASAGFNDARGMNSNPVPGSPYPLDSKGKQGGAGEPGWAGPWSTPTSPQFSFREKVTHEGDGALYMSKAGTDRRLAEPLAGQFHVELFVNVPAGGGFICYLKNGAKPWTSDGPVWSAGDGKFWVLGENDKFQDTGFKSEPGKWHKVTLHVDVPRNEWQFFVDDQQFETPRPLHFRRDQASLDTIRFQCENEAGVYVDALRITREGHVTTPAKDLIASTGFNDARGLNSNPVPGSPFILDTPNREGGVGEPGWTGPWPAHPDAAFQSKVVFEGDGALYLKGRPNFGPNYNRQWTKAQTGRFQVEHYVQVPGGSSFGAYVWQHPRGADWSGPTWGVRNGRFGVHAQLTDFKCVPGQWYKVTLRIDVPSHTWEFFVDGKRFETAKPLGFRGKVEYLDAINFLVEGGVYIDAVRVTRLPEAAKDG